MNEMVERVAKVIDGKLNGKLPYGLYDYSGYPGTVTHPPHVVRDERTGEVIARYWNDRKAKAEWESLCRNEVARAAIEAMREPTQEMLDAGPPEPYLDAEVWSKMLDAALK